jgi:hypothetical protein
MLHSLWPVVIHGLVLGVVGNLGVILCVIHFAPSNDNGC